MKLIVGQEFKDLDNNISVITEVSNEHFRYESKRPAGSWSLGTGQNMTLVKNEQIKPEWFPHAKGYPTLMPIKRFNINGRWLSLYSVQGRTPYADMSLYWDDEVTPVQHAMTYMEVLDVLAGLLDNGN